MTQAQVIAASLEESREFEEVKPEQENFTGDGIVETFSSKLDNPVLPAAFALFAYTKATKGKLNLATP